MNSGAGTISGGSISSASENRTVIGNVSTPTGGGGGGAIEEVKPRSLRFTWSMKTTSSLAPEEMMKASRKKKQFLSFCWYQVATVGYFKPNS